MSPANRSSSSRLPGAVRPWHGAARFLSKRAPVLWRTRTLPIVAIGLVLGTLAPLLARAIPIERTNLPALNASMFYSSAVTVIAAVVLGIIAVSQARRAGQLFVWRQVIAVGAWGFVCALTLLPSFYLLKVTMIRRVASLESDAEAVRLVSFHESHGFWRCRNRHELESDVAANRAVIERDLVRYGFAMYFSLRDYPLCPGQNIIGAVPTESLLVSLDVRTEMDRYADDGAFEQRLKNVQAAKAFVSGQGPYRSDLLSTTSGLFSLATLVGLFLAISATRWRWGPTVVEVLDSCPRPRFIRIRLIDRVNRYLARTWPTLWATQLQSSVPELALAAFLLLALRTSVISPSIGSILLLLFPLLLALRQRQMRSLTTRRGQDLRVYVIHAGVMSLILAGGIIRTTSALEDLVICLGIATTTVSIMHSARISPILHSAVAYILAIASFVGALVSVDTFLPSSSGTNYALSLLAVWLIIAGVVWTLHRREMAPGVRTVLWSTLMFLGPATGIFLGTLRVDINSNIDVAGTAVLAALALLGGLLPLLATREARMRVAASL